MTPFPVHWPLLSGTSDGLFAALGVDGGTTAVGPVGYASGSAPPKVNDKASVAHLLHGYDLDPAHPGRTTLLVAAQGIADQVKSPGFGVDSIGLQATSDIASATLVLTENPLSTLSILGLAVSATFIHASADASYVVGPDKGFLSGGASFGSLTIYSPLIGKTLTFKGDATANDVIFHNSTVTVTLDKQDITGFYPPGAVGASPGSRITTDALDISFNNAHLFGQTISGSIDIGQASATLWPQLPA